MPCRPPADASRSFLLKSSFAGRTLEPSSGMGEDRRGMPRLWDGDYAELGCSERVLTSGPAPLTHVESMEITNDPRFFQDNVINYRLAAFAGLGVVAGLMVQNSMDHLFDMRKDMCEWYKPKHLDSTCQFIAFVLLGLVHLLNVIATYVGVAQPYHTVRLMTAGPTGFESAACYYLNKNIIAWRHFAIKGALISLPMFVASTGLRMVVKFDRENMAEPDPPENLPDTCRHLGFGACSMFMFMACSVFYIHRKHFNIFDERYAQLEANLQQHKDVLVTMSHRNTAR
eukprot:s7757_g2.t1